MYGNMRQPRLQDNYKQQNSEKERADTDLEFFLFLTCLSAGPSTSFGEAQNLGLVTFVSLHCNGSFFTDVFHLFPSRCRLYKVIPSLLHVVSRNINFHLLRTFVKDFGPPVFLSYLLLQRVPQPCCSVITVWFIYLFIYLFACLFIQFPMSRLITLH